MRFLTRRFLRAWTCDGDTMLAVYSPKSFLILAKKLLDDQDYNRETRIRTAIGRAYYAAFLASKAKQEKRGHAFPDDHTIHMAVIDSFQDDHLSHIASKLVELKDIRSDADYHMNIALSSAEGSKCLELAQNIFTMLGTI